jgi:hypothetical protein
MQFGSLRRTDVEVHAPPAALLVHGAIGAVGGTGRIRLPLPIVLVLRVPFAARSILLRFCLIFVLTALRGALCGAAGFIGSAAARLGGVLITLFSALRSSLMSGFAAFGSALLAVVFRGLRLSE